MTINDVIAQLSEINEVEQDLGSASPWIGWLDTIGGKTDEAIIKFSLRTAREFAWQVAQSLAFLTSEQQAKQIQELDRVVALLGAGIVHPPFFLRTGLLFIRARESHEVPQVIDVLS